MPSGILFYLYNYRVLITWFRESFQVGLGGYQSPAQLAQALADTQREQELLLSQKGDIEAKLQLAEATLKIDKQKVYFIYFRQTI